MAEKNEWYTIAEIYRNREHAVLQFVRRYLTEDGITMDDLQKFFNDHVNGTGRSPQSPLELKELTPPDEDTRKQLLRLLAPSQAELEAHIPPPPRVYKHGGVRKTRSDKGVKRVKREVGA